jgi:hypothetical protein
VQEQLARQQSAQRQLDRDAHFFHPAVAEPSPAYQMVVADNRAMVQQEYEAAVAAKEAQRLAQVQQVQSIGRILMWGGAGLMLLVGVLLIARRPIKPIVWIPAVGLAALTLALGLAWYVPQQPAGWTLARLETGELPATETQIAKGPAAHGVPAEPPAVPAILPVDPTTPETPAPQNESLKRMAPPSPGEFGFNGVAEAGRGGAGISGGPKQETASPPGKPGADLKPRSNNAAAADKPTAALAANSPQAKKIAEELEREVVAASDDGAAPDSLFWRPLSAVGDDGLLTIEFTMPAVAADYRLLLDAISPGRMGGEQQLLICRE